MLGLSGSLVEGFLGFLSVLFSSKGLRFLSGDVELINDIVKISPSPAPHGLISSREQVVWGNYATLVVVVVVYRYIIFRYEVLLVAVSGSFFVSGDF